MKNKYYFFCRHTSILFTETFVQYVYYLRFILGNKEEHDCDCCCGGGGGGNKLGVTGVVGINWT